uniref:Vimentin-like isoform X3 n=1 Tax=Diabrotica virgifera virgifera TaxID=50390 RepID=A0A6P7GZ02_DIAVI
MMQVLTEETKNLAAEVKDIKEDQREYWKELRELRDEIEKVKQANQKSQIEKDEMKKELNDTKLRLEKLEKERKANNVVIQGLQIDTNDRDILRQTIGNFMEAEMNIKVKIDEVIKLGEKTCLVKLPNHHEKETVMKNKAKLQHAKDRRVFINNDMTKEDLQVQKKIRQVGHEEANKGKNVKVKFNKLIINGKTMKWNKNSNQLEESPEGNPKN